MLHHAVSIDHNHNESDWPLHHQLLHHNHWTNITDKWSLIAPWRESSVSFSARVSHHHHHHHHYRARFTCCFFFFFVCQASHAGCYWILSAIPENRNRYNYPHLVDETTEAQSGVHKKRQNVVCLTWNKLAATMRGLPALLPTYCRQGQRGPYPLHRHHPIARQHLFSHSQYDHLNEHHC